MVKTIPLHLKEKGLICFEEITDYSILGEKLNKLKRKSSDGEDHENKPKKKKLKQETKKDVIKKEKKKKTAKKSTKKVKFSDKVEVKAENEAVKEVKIEKKKKKKLKKKKVNKDSKQEDKSTKLTKKKNKSQKSNSTSRLSMQTKDNLDLEYDKEDFESKMASWKSMMLPNELLRALYDKGFYEPMPIQSIVLPEAIKSRSNIIGTAQTGSGKTLAFGLPILSQMIDSYDANTNQEFDGPQALILTPTRELAIQIKDHLQVCSKYTKIKIAVVVGGISQLKQERLLRKNPEIVVATPGRLMQMIEECNEYLSKIHKIKYLVIDEADRMIEKGHFSEMEKILSVINSDEKSKQKRQNFLFSATLITKYSGDYIEEDIEQETDPKRKEKLEAKMKKEQKETLNALVDKIQMMKAPKVFDLTTKAVTAENLIESKIFCSIEEKDTYLYYFSCKYSGRTLVFANSIDCVRRLTNLFRLLKKEPLHLHANMDQKQRLKNLEKFNANENSLLIASDVASRGLDIPGVMHVIHYQVPRSAEIYVHRSGRTARSSFEGLSVMLISADEMNLYRKILKTFKREKDLKDYPIDIDYFEEAKIRVTLARKIDKLDHQMSKEKNNSSWYEKHAKMLDIELDDEIIKETYVDRDITSKNKNELNKLKQQLDKQLKKIIMPKFMSKNYLGAENFQRVLDINKKNNNALTEMKNQKNPKKKNFRFNKTLENENKND